MYHYRVFSVISLRDISFFLFKITRGISDPCPLSSYDNNFIFFPSTIHSKRLYSAIFFIEKFNPGKILLLKSSESSDHPRETSVRKLFKFYFEIPLLVSPLSSKNIFDPPLPVRNHWRRSAVSSLPVSPKIANRERTILQCCWFPYMQIRAATHARIFPRSPNQPACPCS